MKKVFPILSLATLVLTSCSSNNVSQHVVADIPSESREVVESLFTIKASNISLADEDLEKRTLLSLKNSATGNDIKFELIEDKRLQNDILFMIEPRTENNQSIVKIRYADDAFKDHAATLNLTRFMDGLLHSTPLSLFEIYQSAVNNDSSSHLAVAKIRKSILTPLTTDADYAPINLSQYNGYIQGEAVIWNKKLLELTKIDQKKNVKKRKVAAIKKEEETPKAQ